VPVNADVPSIEVQFVDIPDPHTPIGAHGIGEIGITGVTAAIAKNGIIFFRIGDVMPKSRKLFKL
jgi:hypothetical protein